MSKEQTPIETMFEKWLFIKFGMGGATEDNLTPSEWVEFAQWLSQAKVLEALEDKYSHEDIIHALSYGYKGAKSH
jgi:hypothetical protein